MDINQLITSKYKYKFNSKLNSADGRLQLWIFICHHILCPEIFPPEVLFLRPSVSPSYGPDYRLHLEMLKSCFLFWEPFLILFTTFGLHFFIPVYQLLNTLFSFRIQKFKQTILTQFKKIYFSFFLLLFRRKPQWPWLFYKLKESLWW